MVRNKSYIPEKGDIVWIDLSPTRGHEQANVRPVVVVSPRAYNKKLGLLVACPVTSQVKGYPFEVIVDEKKIAGVVLVDQIRSMDWRSRNVKFIQKASADLIAEVSQKIKILLFE